MSSFQGNNSNEIPLQFPNSEAYQGERAFGREITNYYEMEQFRQNPSSATIQNNNNNNYNNNNSNNFRKTVNNNKSQSNIMPKIIPYNPQVMLSNSNLNSTNTSSSYHSQNQMQIEAEKELLRISEEDKMIPESASQYQRKIFDFLKEREPFHKIGEYMDTQKDLSDKMRGILVDWLVDVHFKYKMVPETLFLTIFLIDKYLEQNKVSREKLQLVGISALFIASKYEEIYPPHIKDFVEVTDRSYTKNELLEMESKIIMTVDFNLTVPSPLRFLDRYARLLTGDQRVYFLARYLIELQLLDYSFVKYSCSNLAASSLYLAMKIYKKRESWNNTLEYHSKFKEVEVRPLAKELCFLLQSIQNSKLTGLKRKFSSTQYLEISKIYIDKIQVPPTSQPQQQQQQQLIQDQQYQPQQQFYSSIQSQNNMNTNNNNLLKTEQNIYTNDQMQAQQKFYQSNTLTTDESENNYIEQ